MKALTGVTPSQLKYKETYLHDRAERMANYAELNPHILPFIDECDWDSDPHCETYLDVIAAEQQDRHISQLHAAARFDDLMQQIESNETE